MLSSVSLICVSPLSFHIQSIFPAQSGLTRRVQKKGRPPSTRETQEQEQPHLGQAQVSGGCHAAVWPASQQQYQASGTEKRVGGWLEPAGPSGTGFLGKGPLKRAIGEDLILLGT